MTPIKYIGKRPSYADNQYSHQTFNQGESILVPDDVAAKMLKHPDQYVPGDKKTAKTVDSPSQKPDEDTQDLRDAILQMDSAALIAIAKNDYGINLDAKRPVATLRTQVVQLVDQYGAV
jgi:hypothetical protein